MKGNMGTLELIGLQLVPLVYAVIRYSLLFSLGLMLRPGELPPGALRISTNLSDNGPKLLLSE